MKPIAIICSTPVVIHAPCCICGRPSTKYITRAGGVTSASPDGLVHAMEIADICDLHLPAQFQSLPRSVRQAAVNGVWANLDYIVWQRPPRVLLRRQTVRSKLVCLSRFAQWRKRLRRAFAFYVAAPHGESPVK